MTSQQGEHPTKEPSKARGYPALPVLVVDDDKSILQLFKFALRARGIENVIACDDGNRVSEIFAHQEIGAMLLDLSMPQLSGQDLLARITAEYPQVPIIVITGLREVDTAVECMKAGAFDYMVKPVDESRLVSGVRRALELRELKRENERLKESMFSGTLAHPEAFSEIVTVNANMRSIFQYIETISESLKPLLITGETGVGKELFAKAVHDLSRKEEPYVAVNVAGLDDSLFSDTLYGHVSGAYTGATEARQGLLERATKGTLFLDEIGDLSAATQVKLLRTLQGGDYYPIGSDVSRRTDTRFVFATNQNIEALQAQGTFRKDLFYRLSAHRIHIPPLRERLEDVPLLVDRFLERAAETLGKPKPTPPKELSVLLATYDFPGNVRELESLVFEAVSRHASKVLSMDTFKARIASNESSTPRPSASVPTDVGIQFPRKLPTLKETSDALISEALARAAGNQTIAAGLLGISGAALSKRLKKTRDLDTEQAK